MSTLPVGSITWWIASEGRLNGAAQRPIWLAGGRSAETLRRALGEGRSGPVRGPGANSFQTVGQNDVCAFA